MIFFSFEILNIFTFAKVEEQKNAFYNDSIISSSFILIFIPTNLTLALYTLDLNLLCYVKFVFKIYLKCTTVKLGSTIQEKILQDLFCIIA